MCLGLKSRMKTHGHNIKTHKPEPCLFNGSKKQGCIEYLVSHRIAKNMAQGVSFGRFDGWAGVSVSDNFGIN